ncbi:cupredoxin domain-containing protein [Arthrobacter sp. H5]|uniref:cupredoxin domain-containing protein n=1 Tax=Arthrobacter sp. H5 TaxID=1267973 RepID=UPI0004AF7659|nr:cupredoxin domain-containing protein [Arthrobacter sp. H5]
MNTKNKVLSISFSAALACGAMFGSAGAASATYAPTALPAMTQAAPVTISITDFKYTISGPVAPGATVTVVNNDVEVHTVTGVGSGQSFDSGSVPGGETGTFVAPNSPGEYNFTCTFHATMTGTLVVQEGGSASSDDSSDDEASGQADSGAAAPGEAGDNTGTDQMGQMPVGGADTGAEQTAGGNLGLLALGGGFVLVAAAGGTYMVRRRSE